jgi:hypothetical protein
MPVTPQTGPTSGFCPLKVIASRGPLRKRNSMKGNQDFRRMATGLPKRLMNRVAVRSTSDHSPDRVANGKYQPKEAAGRFGRAIAENSSI